MMKKIPRQARCKRPSFFNDSATDQLITMMLETMSELWVVKERLYTLEKVLEEQGLSVRQPIDSCRFTAEEMRQLEDTRRQFVESIMRSLEANFVTQKRMQSEIDELREEMQNS